MALLGLAFGSSGYALRAAVVRTSLYVPVRDGTRLALDLYADGGLAPDQRRRPVLLTMTPYQRARRDADGTVQMDPVAVYFARNGYVVAIGDIRGKGASYGSRGAPSDQTETNDMYDMIEWLAAQPWSSGQVGMQGCSYVGSTVTAGLRSAAPHLRAAAVGSTQFDMMTTFTDGGVPRSRPLSDEADGVDADLARAVPVDADRDGELLRGTRTDKLRNLSTGAIWRSAPFRDSVSALTGDRYWITSSVYAHRAEIERAGVPIFLYGSWNDPFVTETVNAWLTLRNRKMLLMGHGAHCESPDYDRDAQLLRFFDHWLKGAPNGIDREPRVTYYLENGPYGHEWRSAADWPLPAAMHRFRLGQNSAGAGTLLDGAGGEGALTVAPPADVEPITNFSVVHGNIDPVSVTFTSAPLPAEAILAGSPVVHLTVSAPARDYVVHAFLEHLNPRRTPIVVSRGMLAASRRKLGRAPYETGGVPYASQLAADSSAVAAGEPVELSFGLSAVMRRLLPGDQLRLAVTIRAAKTDPVLPLTVQFGGTRAGSIDIPLAAPDAILRASTDAVLPTGR